MEISHPVHLDKVASVPVVDRCVKLPIENYLDIIGIEPVPAQYGIINLLNLLEIKYVTAVVSRRQGKTYIGNIIAHLISLVPDCNILVMAPDYSLTSISWDLQQQFIKKFGVEVTKNNAKDKVIELKNGSTVRVGSVGKPDSVIGRSYDFILYDEAAINDKGGEVFFQQLMPTLDRIGSKVLFITTPRGRNWVHDFYMKGFDLALPEWGSILATYKDNPRHDPARLAADKLSMPTAYFKQEHLCEFTVMQGLIWEIDKDVVVRSCPFNSIDVIAGLDLGYKDDTAFIVGLTDGYNLHISSEYISANVTTSIHAAAINSMIEELEIDIIYADPAAAQARADLAYDYDIGTVAADNSRMAGIGFVASMIRSGRLTVDPSCIWVIKMFENYVWDSKVGLLNQKPKHDKHSHPADAIRYMAYSYRRNFDEESP